MVFIADSVKQHGTPTVVGCRAGLAQRDSNLFKAKPISKLSCNGLVALAVDLAGIDIGRLRLNAEHILGILLVGNAYVHVLTQISHGLACLLTAPQLAAVVEITANLEPVCLRRLAGVTAGIHHVGAKRRRDTGKVEPVRASKNHIPVEVGGSGLLNGRMRPVINANGTALRRAFLIIVDTDTVASTHDHRGIHAVAAQRVDRSLSDGMRGQLGDVDGVKAVVSQRNSYVSFPATERKLQVVRLNKALVIVWLETNHQFSKGYYFRHTLSSYRFRR